MVRFEIMNNGDYYKQFANDDDDIAYDLERYVRDKVYSQNTNDLVVYALANCLCVKIRLFELDEEEHCYRIYTEPIPPARRSGPARAEIDLLRTNEHYDALVAVKTGKSIENRWKKKHLLNIFVRHWLLQTLIAFRKARLFVFVALVFYLICCLFSEKEFFPHFHLFQDFN